MKFESGTIEGNISIADDLNLLGTVKGSITVAFGGKLYLRGTCTNNLIVQPGGIAFIFGTVGNDVHNAGTVELEGTVNGNVLSIGSSFKKSDEAFVRGALLV